MELEVMVCPGRLPRRYGGLGKADGLHHVLDLRIGGVNWLIAESLKLKAVEWSNCGTLKQENG
jgi:hypothetical protein